MYVRTEKRFSMLRCEYCGRENDPKVRSCVECGAELSSPASDVAEETEPVTPIPEPEWVKLDSVEDAFSFDSGFSRPDWPVITRAVERVASPPERDAAWQEVAWQWMDQLRQDIGGNYRVRASEDFLLLSNVSRDTAERILRFAENALVTIRETMGDLAWRGDCGKHPILMFSDDDAYYEYISFFYSADEMPATMGVHISQGLPHIVIKAGTEQQDCMVIAHELAHNCLVHLPIPLWLNEGVAQRLERAISGRTGAQSGGLMRQELAERHHAFWNEDNIQTFWAGTSFHSPGDGRELSYNLAEVLVHLLWEDRLAFPEFVAHAEAGDAGQTSALDYLGKNLGDVVAAFLGEGNWRPLRKSMVQCWQRDNRQVSQLRDAAILEAIVPDEARYSKEAYSFVLRGCASAFKKYPNTNVSAAQLLDCLRELAISAYGAQAKSTLKSWRIFQCSDFGQIVYDLIYLKLLGEGPDDSRDDFKGGYDFESAFPEESSDSACH